MWKWCVCGVLAAGCVSSGTWSSYTRIERALDREASAGRRSPGAPSTCSELASAVVSAFPSSRVGRARARAELARGRSESALPVPEVMLEVWDFPIGDPQRADREGMYMLGVGQAFPPAGALDARASAAAARADARLAEASDDEREIFARALEACVEWSASELEIARYRASEALAAEMRDVVVARVRAGGGASVAEAARLDREIARLRRMQLASEARALRARARVRAWLGEEPAAPPSIDPPRAPDAAALLAGALERRGALRAGRARARAAEAMARAAEAEANVPTFSLRVTYMQAPSMRPGIGAAIGMTLPWLWSGQGAARDAARAEAEAARDEVEGIELAVSAEVQGAAAALEAMTRALDEVRDRERPAALRALEAVRAGITTGGADVGEWLEAARELREIDVEEARLLRETAMAWAELERAIGGAR